MIASIGLEVHVQLKTRTKMFCGCPNQFGVEPNRLVCPVCLGYPGALPVMNAEAIRLTVMTGMLLGCRINLTNKFDRKNYFYPDQAKNYQISQYDQPLCLGGQLEITLKDRVKTVRITRIHLEEDVAKNTHFADGSGIDFNRAGTPLMEIVTEPDMDNEDEAFAFLTALKQVLAYGGISDCNLEQGNIRCDINVSVRPTRESPLGRKVEIKNMNTFRGAHRALAHEIHRQIREVQRGTVIPQETRRWDDDAGVTSSMRSKEYAHDYRYFPEPDLLPVSLTQEQVDGWRAMLPEMPAARRERMVREYGIPEYDAGVLAADRAVADFFEQAARQCGKGKAVSNWMMTEMLRLLAEVDGDIGNARITPTALAELVNLVDAKTINQPAAKEVFALLFASGGDPKAIVQEKGLAQVSDSSALQGLVDQVVAENARSVEDYRKGKEAALQFLIGQVMKLSRGKANPQVARELLVATIGAP
ncbi:MAG TPA: Asp-tRNA(Asn)/Glu-tRNA(Gln) amidotransferase subunit GatB [Kiritimatiellia bacterium]|nr:Asp-tRNA(Asn)/Glu-tRNA(Gln) amidotransferase subunit GatB [Kiritimatiellia bacterium]